MSQRDNFGSGFLVGALVGGTIGGVIGAIVASRYRKEIPVDPETPVPIEGEENRDDRGGELPLRQSLYRRRMSEARMENARRSLEGKIAQLNNAIDDVRQQFEEPNR
ncbi:MAG: hypothetical protein ACOYME_12120 [Prochlorotrichaceae cyanobacterium]|jgi:hypothetical protein